MPEEQIIIEETPPLVLNDAEIRNDQLKTGIKPSWLDEQPKGKEDTPVKETTDKSTSENSSAFLEEIAAKTGWTPKDKFTGKEEDWVDAKEWIVRGVEIQRSSKDSFKSLAKTNKDLRKSIDDLKRINDTVHKAKVQNLEQQIAELKASKKTAISDADADKVEKIEQNIDSLSSDLQQAKQQLAENQTPEEKEPDQLFVSWKEKNPWYETDKEMTAFVDGIAAEYGDKLKLDRLLTIVDTKVKDAFPDKVQNQQSSEKKAPVGTVEAPSRRGADKVKTKLTVNDLTDKEKESMRRFIKTKTMTQEEYLAAIAEYRTV